MSRQEPKGWDMFVGLYLTTQGKHRTSQGCYRKHERLTDTSGCRHNSVLRLSSIWFTEKNFSRGNIVTNMWFPSTGAQIIQDLNKLCLRTISLSEAVQLMSAFLYHRPNTSEENQGCKTANFIWGRCSHYPPWKGTLCTLLKHFLTEDQEILGQGS